MLLGIEKIKDLEKFEKYLEELKEECLKLKDNLTKEKFEKLKIELAKKHKVEILKSTTILELIKEKFNIDLRKYFILKPIRQASGTLIITLSTIPYFCGGNCIYCPSIEGIPRSYSLNEPTMRRAKRNNFDPYLQVKERLYHYKLLGLLSENSKIEIVILGTFTTLPKNYREEFIKKIFDALNEKESKNLEEAQKINETSKYRCVSLTVESRPDYLNYEIVDDLLRYGTTRIEIGVQSVYDDVLEFVKRNHGTKEVKEATKICRDAGLKITYHIMPNLPNSDLDRDLEMFKILFEDENYRPDYLKIYPCQIFKNAELYELYKEGKFKLYDFEDLVEMLAKALKFIPKYCRIQRLGRDFPLGDFDIGYKYTNLREFVIKKAKELKIKINEIREREIGIKMLKGYKPDFESLHIEKIEYDANNGKEIFLSFEDKNEVIYAFLRLRIPEKSWRKEIDDKASIVRELKTFGFHVPVNSESKFIQHKGLGKALMQKAEEISLEYGKSKIAVISAIGTREYYRKLGYEKEGYYMVKKLR